MKQKGKPKGLWSTKQLWKWKRHVKSLIITNQAAGPNILSFKGLRSVAGVALFEFNGHTVKCCLIRHWKLRWLFKIPFNLPFALTCTNSWSLLEMLYWETFCSDESSKIFCVEISILLTQKKPPKTTTTTKNLKAKYFILSQFSISGKTPHR